MAETRKRDDWRPSRDERAPYISALNEALADERLSADEHDERVASAEAATSFTTLDGLVADLPFEWHDEKFERTQTTDRRRFVLGIGALVGITAASWVGTRAWVKSGDGAEATGRGGGGEVGSNSASSESDSSESEDDYEETVPTDLVQVLNWRKDTVPSAIEHATALGLTMVGRIQGGGDDVTVKGSNENDEWITVSFRKGYRPTVDTDTSQSPSDKWLRPAEIPVVDVAALHDEVKSELSKNTQSHQLDIGYDLTADEWLVLIWDGPDYFAWTLDGLKRVKRD